MDLIDYLRRQPFWQTPGINPNEPQPGIQHPRWMQGLSSPLAQVGLRMLANSRDQRGNPVGLGNAAGGAVLGYQQDQSDQQQQQLNRRYLEAQIKRMETPDPPAQRAPVIVTGPDGRPRYEDPSAAIGQQPWMQPSGATQGPSEVEIARVLNDPATPQAVKSDLRKLIEQKYRDQSEPLVAIQTPNGQVLVPRSQASGQTPAATREAPTEGERTSANYLGRMEEAEKLLGDYRPNMVDYVGATRTMTSGPMMAGVYNKAVSEEGQKFYQAAADWVRAKLRKESGAVISPEEMAQEIKTYFPVPGDTDATIKQKANARQQAMEGMKGMSGRAVQPAAQPSSGGWGKATVVQ
jgi:hypothetical protein